VTALAVWLFAVCHWVLSYVRNERDRPCDDRTTGAAAHSRAEESAVVDEVGLQDARGGGTGHVQPGPQSLDDGASE
jgi:hypothetical protein